MSASYLKQLTDFGSPSALLPTPTSSIMSHVSTGPLQHHEVLNNRIIDSTNATQTILDESTTIEVTLKPIPHNLLLSLLPSKKISAEKENLVSKSQFVALNCFDNFCTQGVRQNACKTLSSILPPDKPPDEFVAVMNEIYINRMVLVDVYTALKMGWSLFKKPALSPNDTGHLKACQGLFTYCKQTSLQLLAKIEVGFSWKVAWHIHGNLLHIMRFGVIQEINWLLPRVHRGTFMQVYIICWLYFGTRMADGEIIEVKRALIDSELASRMDGDGLSFSSTRGIFSWFYHDVLRSGEIEIHVDLCRDIACVSRALCSCLQHLGSITHFSLKIQSSRKELSTGSRLLHEALLAYVRLLGSKWLATRGLLLSISRVGWSPDGLRFGVAFSKNLVYIYSYHVEDLRNHLEIEAYTDSVNDIVFSYPNKQWPFVTCGEDRIIKVWDSTKVANQFSFEGHEAPVYSVCPHHKETIQFLFSILSKGKIKAWHYDNMGFRVHYDAPANSSTKMAPSDDGTRLFSYGTNKEGESHLVEWNENEGAVRRSYYGLGKRYLGIVQFDIARNQIFAAGDESVVKYWDMDKIDLLATTDADGGSPTSPCLRFSKEGIFLAVSINDNGIKVLANGDGVKILWNIKHHLRDPSRAFSMAATAAKVQTPNLANFGVIHTIVGSNTGDQNASMMTMSNVSNDNRGIDVKSSALDEAGEISRAWKLTKVSEPSHCRSLSLRLPDNVSQIRIVWLIYTNSGVVVFALVANGAHKLWRWSRNVGNVTKKVFINYTCCTLLVYYMRSHQKLSTVEPASSALKEMQRGYIPEDNQHIMILFFSLSRPPEASDDVDLEDKVNFKGRGMLRMFFIRTCGT